MRTSNKILLFVLCALAITIKAGPSVTTEYICNSNQGNVWFEEVAKARLLEAELVPETSHTALNPKPTGTVPAPESKEVKNPETPKVEAAEKPNSEKPAEPEQKTPVAAPKPEEKTAPAKKEVEPEAKPQAEPTVPKKDMPVPQTPEVPAPQPADKSAKKEETPVAPAEKKDEKINEQPAKSTYPKAEFSVRVKMQTGLPADAIKAGCVAQLDKLKSMTHHNSKFYTVLGGAATVILVLLLALSCYYKSHLNKHKQAPFAVPQWVPEILFPKFDFYYEQEMTYRMKRERLHEEDEI